MLRVVPWEEDVAVARASWIAPNRSGNAGRYFSVLNCASENGLSLETWGPAMRLRDPQVGEQEREQASRSSPALGRHGS